MQPGSGYPHYPLWNRLPGSSQSRIGYPFCYPEPTRKSKRFNIDEVHVAKPINALISTVKGSRKAVQLVPGEKTGVSASG